MDSLIGSGQLTAMLGVLVALVAVLSPALIVLRRSPQPRHGRRGLPRLPKHR